MKDLFKIILVLVLGFIGLTIIGSVTLVILEFVFKYILPLAIVIAIIAMIVNSNKE